MQNLPPNPTPPPILQVIFQKSLDSGKLPHIWKEAHMSPIFLKKDTKQTLPIMHQSFEPWPLWGRG